MIKYNTKTSGVVRSHTYCPGRETVLSFISGGEVVLLFDNDLFKRKKETGIFKHPRVSGKRPIITVVAGTFA